MNEYIGKAVERDVYRILWAFAVLSAIALVSAFMLGRCMAVHNQPQQTVKEKQ